MNAHRDLEQLMQLTDRVTGFVQEFWQTIESRPASAGDQHMCPLPLSEDGDGFEATMSCFEKEIAPKLSGSAGPRYWAFVTGGTTPAAMMGDWLAAGVDQNLSSAGDSVASDVEVQVINWLKELFHLPEDFFGIITSGATSANLLGIMCGRQHTGRRLGFDVAKDGMAKPIKVLSACPHASLIKSLGMAGMGHNAWLHLPTLPGREAMDVDALDEALKQAGGNAFVVASAGTVTSTDFDDLTRISEICKAHGAWLHVDSAFGLFAAVTDPHDPRLAGIAAADSITCDGHKWLNVPYDSGFFFTRHPEVLASVCHVGAPYLETRSQTPNFLSYGIENSRRFRALPIWFALKAYGREGVKEIVANCIARAAQLAQWLNASPHYTLLTPCTLNVVIFTLKEDLVSNQQLLADINASGLVAVTPGAWFGRPCIRTAFSNWLTRAEDVEQVCQWLENYAHNA